jgi:eukaryotic-like serine/threonine-protein kinase
MVGQPERIGRYRIERVIGAGGFATVYLAHDERLDARVAVKLLAENHCLDPDVRERFLKEGRMLRRVASPHVVTIHDLGETDRGQPYLVLDHADRGTLAERTRARRAAGWSPGLADLGYVAGALADSLGAVHGVQVVHRDIAPRNLLLRSVRSPASLAALAASGAKPSCEIVEADEQLVLADLGLSKDLAAASGLTVAGGTAGYTPPEQREGPARVDTRADIWSASAVLVWLLLDEPPDDAGRWQGDVDGRWPPSLVAAMARGLEPQPDDRFASIAEWHAAVTDALRPTAVTAVRAADAAPAAAASGGEALTGGTGGPVPTAGVRGALAGSSGPTARDDGPAAPRRRGGVWRLVVVAAVAAVLASLVTVLVTSAGGDGDEVEQSVEHLGNGRVRVTAEDGDRRVVLSGPDEVTVGETATYESAVRGVEHWVWYGPDGGVHPDAKQIEVGGSSPGRATVRLQGVDGQNRPVEAVLQVDIVEE